MIIFLDFFSCISPKNCKPPNRCTEAIRAIDLWQFVCGSQSFMFSQGRSHLQTPKKHRSTHCYYPSCPDQLSHFLLDPFSNHTSGSCPYHHPLIRPESALGPGTKLVRCCWAPEGLARPHPPRRPPGREPLAIGESVGEFHPVTGTKSVGTEFSILIIHLVFSSCS